MSINIIFFIISTLGNIFISWFILIPLVFFIIFFSITTFYLYFSLKNIFKIFFLTEVLLLLIVILLIQMAAIYPDILFANYFYSQIILAAAAAEGALFLGLFSHLYDQQFTNWIGQIKISKNFNNKINI